jgi:hypothetical protein
MKRQIIKAIQQAVKMYPDVLPHLDRRARYIAALGSPIAIKTYDELLAFMESTIRDLYIGKLGTLEFTDDVARALAGHVTDAYDTAWRDSADEEEEQPDWFIESRDVFIENTADMDYIYSFFEDIMEARDDKDPLLPLLDRAKLWANRWNEAYSEAVKVIALQNGTKLKWVEGDTTEKCDVCLALNGIIAPAALWDELDVKPQSAPNPALDKENGGCGGWRCQCYFEETDEKQTRGARARILQAIGRE